MYVNVFAILQLFVYNKLKFDNRCRKADIAIAGSGIGGGGL